MARRRTSPPSARQREECSRGGEAAAHLTAIGALRHDLNRAINLREVEQLWATSSSFETAQASEPIRSGRV